MFLSFDGESSFSYVAHVLPALPTLHILDGPVQVFAEQTCQLAETILRNSVLMFAERASLRLCCYAQLKQIGKLSVR